MEIRPFKSEDVDDIHSILQKTGVFKPQEIECALEIINLYLSHPEQRDYSLSCSIDENHKPVGYVCYGKVPLTDAVYDLYWIAVEPGHQNKGVGRVLLDYVEKDVSNCGGRMLVIETSSLAVYEKTRLFYQHHDYMPLATIPDFYSLGDDKILFIKRLDKK